METVNLEKICELLGKGVENPLILNEEGKFNLKKWKEEVQVYTEPVLSIITKMLNEEVIQVGDLWKTTGFKIMKKYQAKQTRISSLQEAKWELIEPFVIEARPNDLRPINGFISIGPSADFAGGIHTSSLCWGLRWWGTGEKAKKVHEILQNLNPDAQFTAAFFSDGNFGSSTWLFDAITAKELRGRGVEAISLIIKEDFVKLSSILWDKREIFGGDNIVPPLRTPTRGDVERAVLRIWSENRQRKIDKTLVMKMIDADMTGKGIALKSDWWTSIEEELKGWFG